MRPIVSIIIPAYNCADVISPAIESAVRQTYSPCEVIVIDDGSTDDTEARIAPYRDVVKFVRTPNRGGNFARQHGADISAGKYLQFLDADDYLDLDKIEVQAQMLEASPSAGCVFGKVRILQEVADGTILNRGEFGADSGHDLCSDWLMGHVAQTNSVLWKREFFDEIGGWNLAMKSIQDKEIAMRAIMANEQQIIYDPTPRAIWLKSPRNSVSKAISSTSALASLDLTEVFIDWLEKRPDFDRLHRYIAQSLWGGVVCLSGCDKRLAAARLSRYRRLGYIRWRDLLIMGKFSALTAVVGVPAALTLKALFQRRSITC
jgi:glycosyltransferase involved in cell wall biosynthesis